MKIQHKRSNQLTDGKAKAPTSEFMEYGELAVNFNETDPAIFIKDSDDNIVRIAGAGSEAGGIPGGPDKPTDGNEEGDLWYDTNLNIVFYWDGNEWVQLSQNTVISGTAPSNPIDGQLWWNTNDNILYIYYDDGDTEQWVITVPQTSFSQQDADGLYLPLTGGNLSGDLTLGTDKITLDATDGTVTCGPFIGSTTGRTGYSFQYDVDGLARFAFGEQKIGSFDTGYMRVQHLTGGGSTNYTDIFQSNDDLKISLAGEVGIGSGAGSSITLNSNGSAEFAGFVTATSDNILGEGNLILRHPNRLQGNLGKISARDKDGNSRCGIGFSAPSDTSPANIYYYVGTDPGDTSQAIASLTSDGFNVGGIVNPNNPGSPNVELNADGSASFAGGIASSATNEAFKGEADLITGGSFFRARAGSAAFDKYFLYGDVDGIGPTCQLKTDGSAEFAGDITSGSNNRRGQFKANMYPGAGDADKSAGLVINYNDVLAAQIKYDGSAEFAGDVRGGRLFATPPSTTIGLQVANASDDNKVVFNVLGLGDVEIGTDLGNLGANINLNNDGSASFTGGIDANNVSFKLEPDNDDNYTVTTEEYEEQEELTPYVPAVDPVVGPLGNVLVEGTPAVEATYQTVTKTREIRTYTGPTLDVKERLQNLIARLDAMEANEVIDDATDNSLLLAVAELTTRLNERDAVITSLTTRLEALEAGTADS